MTNIPALIEAFTPTTSQLIKVGENGSIKKVKTSNDRRDHHSTKLETNSSLKNEPQVDNHRNHTASKGKIKKATF
jgi:hypothetical protein